MAVDTAERASGRGRQTASVEDARERHIERHALTSEDSDAWKLARLHAHRIHLAVVAERPDIADQSAGAIVVLADRRLRQIGGDAA